MRERLATLISGGGTTMREIIKASQSGEIPMDIACVISSSPTAGGIEKARSLGIPDKDIIVVDPNDFRGKDKKVDQEGFGLALLKVLRGYGVTVVTQNGWMPRTPEHVIDEYRDTIFNQHPGPKKETRATHGLQPHAIMLYIARQTGRNMGTEVITHRVNEEWDNGPTVGIMHVPILDINEVPEVLQARALPIEHQLQITLLQQLARGDVKEVFSQAQYIGSGEEHILRDARRYARKIYPEG